MLTPANNFCSTFLFIQQALHTQKRHTSKVHPLLLTFKHEKTTVAMMYQTLLSSMTLHLKFCNIWVGMGYCISAVSTSRHMMLRLQTDFGSNTSHHLPHKNPPLCQTWNKKVLVKSTLWLHFLGQASWWLEKRQRLQKSWWNWIFLLENCWSLSKTRCEVFGSYT